MILGYGVGFGESTVAIVAILYRRTSYTEEYQGHFASRTETVGRGVLKVMICYG
jgi:hypothetical protein